MTTPTWKPLPTLVSLEYEENKMSVELLTNFVSTAVKKVGEGLGATAPQDEDWYVKVIDELRRVEIKARMTLDTEFNLATADEGHQSSVRKAVTGKLDKAHLVAQGRELIAANITTVAARRELDGVLSKVSERFKFSSTGKGGEGRLDAYLTEIGCSNDLYRILTNQIGSRHRKVSRLVEGKRVVEEQTVIDRNFYAMFLAWTTISNNASYNLVLQEFGGANLKKKVEASMYAGPIPSFSGVVPMHFMVNHTGLKDNEVEIISALKRIYFGAKRNSHNQVEFKPWTLENYISVYEISSERKGATAAKEDDSS